MVTAATEERRARRRAAHYRGRVNQADTSKKQLLAICGWLVAEAWRAGRMREVTTAVLAILAKVRRGEPL